MGKNLEIKIKVSSHKDIEKILEKIGAEFIEKLIQKDTYYRYSGGLLKLRNVNGKGEFIKYNRNESASERWSDYKILHVEPDETEEFFGDILTKEAVVKKVRNLWIYKTTRIHLDEVEKLGEFIELETVVGDSLEEARNNFDEMVSLLGLNVEEQLKTSYRTLVLDK